MSKTGKDPEKLRLGRIIAAARDKARLTQAELATKMGITQQSVNEWEKGDTLPRGNRLDKLLRTLPALRSEFPQIAQQAHHFALSLQDWAILTPDDQQHVDDLLTLIENIVKRAASQGGLARPKS